MKLTNSQKLEVVNFALSCGISPEQVIFNGEKSRLLNKFGFKLTQLLMFGSPVSKIQISNTKYYLEIRSFGSMGKSSSNLFYNPDSGLLEKVKGDFNGQIISGKFYNNWDSIFATIKLWLREVKNELNAIQELKRMMFIPGIEYVTFDSFDEQFSQEEKEQLRIGIENIKRDVAIEFDLSDYKLNLINRKLDDLNVKLDNLNKFDFRSAFFGIFINITSSILYDHSKDFLNLVVSSFPLLLNSGRI